MTLRHVQMAETGEVDLGAPVRSRADESAPAEPADGGRLRLTLLGALVISMFWSIGCGLILELSLASDGLQVGGQDLLGRGMLPFLVGCCLLWFGLAFLLGLLGRFWVSAAIMLALVLILAIANYIKLSQREEPLYPSDFDFALEWRFLVSMVSPVKFLTLILLVATSTLGIVWLGRWAAKRYPNPRNADNQRVRRRVATSRIVALVVASVVISQALNFNHAGNLVRGAYEASGARWAWWHQLANYKRNGFVGGFLYNTHVPAMKRPPGYTEESLNRIAKRYTAAADQVNDRRSDTAIRDVNIVIVLSEAFSDLTAIPHVQVAEDPTPFTRELMRQTTSGHMLAQMIGGGTANMEFEALTGMTLALFQPQMNSPFQMLVPEHLEFHSIARYLAADGHRTVAIHPYLSSMYKRDLVYPSLGFKTFIDQSMMAHSDRLEDGQFISDAAAFDEVENQLRRHEEPLLVNLVTMQNHYPTDAVYENPIEIEGLSGSRQALAEGYARGLRYTDTALRRFLTGLERIDEKTAVVFFGDHLPGFWPDEMGASNELLMRSTPYFFWSNYEEFHREGEHLVSPVHFIPMLFELVGQRVPPYFALLDAVRSHVPAMEQGIMVDSTGERIRQSDLSPQARRVLNDYRLVQYDLSIGERFSLREMFAR